MRVWLARSVLALGLVLLVIQLVPVSLTNPAVEADVPAPTDVKAVLRRSCYDCHSRETAWPWYGRVAPVSWLLARDVAAGRRELDFSAWSRYSDRQRARKLRETWEKVQKGDMPPWYYVPLHPGARLSDDDRARLQRWARPAS